MSLNSFNFIILFAVILVCMSVLQGVRKKFETIKTVQLSLLLVASYLYTFLSDWKFCICLVLVTIISYTCAIKIEQTKKKTWLAVGITLLVCLLGYFKYTNFFINSFRSIAGLDSLTINIILPIGISFYVLCV